MTGEQQQRRTLSGNSARLLPAHRKLLKERYGLWDETIDVWRCKSASREDLVDLNFATGVEAPGILLPIQPPGCQEPCEFLYRPDHPREQVKNGKMRKNKYEHPLRAQNHIHVPRALQARLFGPGGNQVRVLVVTEGPIKAEVAVQNGIDCVALMGVWSWRQRFGDESVPIEDLLKVPWSEFDAVEICFDSDAANNPNVLTAEQAFAGWLL
jgi:hypothetical protein